MKVDIISGFLGAGKTTLIKKLLEEAYLGEKLVIIENEYGEIGIDGTILKDYGIEIKEMNSGCICCTIAGDFTQALKEIVSLYQPDRIIIEPSGVGKLSDVIKGCKQLIDDNRIKLNICMTVIDGMKYKMYIKNFAEFYKDQLMNAKTIIISRSQFMKPEALEFLINDIRNYNHSAILITTEWDQLHGSELVKHAEDIPINQLESNTLQEVVRINHVGKVPDKTYKIKKHTNLLKEHHHANEVFSVWSRETARIFNDKKLNEILRNLTNIKGIVLRAKGIIQIENNQWVQFDYVPGECNVKEIAPDYIGRICVIGENINESELVNLFELQDII